MASLAGESDIAADSALLADDRDTARRLFMQAFRLAPEVCSPFAVEWDELLQGTDWHFEYRLYLLAQTRHDYPEEVGEDADELRSIYGRDPEKLRLIDDVAGGGAVPRFTEGEQER